MAELGSGIYVENGDLMVAKITPSFENGKQAIARMNRPYENEAQEMVKPHGFVLDFVGVFDKL